MNSLEELMQKLGISEPGSEPMSREEYEQHKVDSYNAGIGHLDQADGYNCDACKNKGYIAELRMAEIYGYKVETLVPCKCQKARNALSRLARSGLRDVVKKYTFDRYEATEPWQQTLKETAQRFCADPGERWFFYGGQSGAGKTHICTAIAVHFLRQGMETKYMLWRDEIARIKALVNDAEQYGAMMQEIKNADVLYIDDLFKTGKDDFGKVKQPTPADINAAFEIINFRYNDPRKITIISSERTISDLNEIDEAIAGRIAEKSKADGYCINLGRDAGKNYRMKGMLEL